ncbi:DUF2254 domain-containing protein [Ilumatobacter sp.]|uniref:DUF2254 domain-containing protein n=1 Tax=Ilumatobacter sp. TaxID=1967498 RepID=UPI003C5C2764
MLRKQAFIERIRENLWFWPVVTAIVSVGLAYLLAQVGPLDDTPVDPLLVDVSAGSVRSLLATLLAAMVTASSVVASLTIVALQTASTQFSPRLLRNFIRDGSTQFVLAYFVGTSGLLVTLTIEADDDTARVAVTVAFVAVLLSVVVIAYFFNHVSQSIRVESIMHTVMSEACEAVERLDHWLATGVPCADDADRIPPAAGPVTASRSGYVQQIDSALLGRIAVDYGVDVHVVPQLGQAVTTGVPFAWTWPAAGEAQTLSPEVANSVASEIRGAFEVGYERTMHHDVGLGLRQLVDMSIKAMSPAVNDPYTSMQAVDHLATILVRLGRVQLDDHAWPPNGPFRVVVPVASFSEFAELACDQLRAYGGRDAAVRSRLMMMLRDVATAVPAEHHRVLRRLVVDCGDSSIAMDHERDRRRVDEVRDEVLEWFDHRIEPRHALRGGL